MTPLVRLVIGGVLVATLVILIWVFWLTLGPSPAEEALKQQNEALVKANEQLTKDAAAKTEEANTLREDANAKLNEIPAIRTTRRAARRDGVVRRDAILTTPDERAADALRAQHERTRRAIGNVRPAAESSTGNGGTTQPR